MTRPRFQRCIALTLEVLRRGAFRERLDPGNRTDGRLELGIEPDEHRQDPTQRLERYEKYTGKPSVASRLRSQRNHDDSWNHDDQIERQV